MQRGLFTILSFLAPALLLAQDAAKPVAATFFSGSVVTVSSSEITVRRRALISNAATQTFLIDSETKIEGKLRVRANVTIRYVKDDEGRVRALGIIVR